MFFGANIAGAYSHSISGTTSSKGSFMGSSGFSQAIHGMNKKAAIWIAVVGGMLSIAAPIVFSIYLAWKHNLNNQINFTASIAQEVLRKSEEGIGQMDIIYQALAKAEVLEPCSNEGIRLMGKLNLLAEQVQTVGYVENNALVCSAYGLHHIPLGQPTFITPMGTKVWTSHELPILPGTKFLILTPKGAGYTVIILPKTFLNVFSNNPHVSVGLYSLSAKRMIVGRGALEAQWLDRLGQQHQTQFTDNDQFVVIQRSSKFEVASVTAQPIAQVNQGLYETAFFLVPIGVLAGSMLALAVFHLARQQMSLPAVLKVAIKRKEFHLHYQPIVDLQTGKWVGAEALIRWRRPTGEMVPPDVFVKAAEEAGLIQEITGLVMEMVALDARHLFIKRPGTHIAINLSAADIESRAIITALERLTRQTHAGPGNLLIEATERGLMRADIAKEILRDIRAMGIHVAIDDFGTGYSSLSYLEKFEIDYLKIDKSFVDTLGKDSATSQVVPHIIEMAKSLQLTMVAEGVETQTQADYLRAHGVQLAQGWLYAKPMPYAEFEARLLADDGAGSFAAPQHK